MWHEKASWSIYIWEFTLVFFIMFLFYELCDIPQQRMFNVIISCLTWLLILFNLTNKQTKKDADFKNVYMETSGVFQNNSFSFKKRTSNDTTNKNTNQIPNQFEQF